MPTAPTTPSATSRLCALLGLMLWTINAFSALVVMPSLIPVFKAFDAKMPAPTQFLWWCHWAFGATCALVVLVILVKECRRVEKKWVDVVLLVLGLLVCIFVQGALWLPFVNSGHSLMGGGK